MAAVTENRQPSELLASGGAESTEVIARLIEHPAQRTEAFFERSETVELLPAGTPDRLRLKREQGISVRRVEAGHGADRGAGGSRLASTDTISGPALASCCDRVAGAAGSIGPPPKLEVGRWPPLRLAEVERAARQLARAVHRRRVAFPMAVTVRRHRRQVQVIHGHMSAPSQFEEYFSLRVKMPWGEWGGLLPSLGEEHLDPVGACLVDRLRSRNLPEQADLPGVIVLGPCAAAVMLHEVVAHTLEADNLALTGAPDDIVGLKLGEAHLDVIDDPRLAPDACGRSSDDEGTTAIARWLLRRGRVRQPLADLAWADRCERLVPGAGRRANRHLPPGPRTTHLELLPSDLPEADLFREAAEGLYIGEFESGAMNPFDGGCVLRAPCARRIGATGPVDFTGPVEIRARAVDLLAAVTAVGDRPLAAGAGWCAKDGALLPVWARSPSMRLEGLA